MLYIYNYVVCSFLRSDYLALLVWFAAGVLVSSALPGAEAISEADKQRAVKAGLAFVKAVLAMLFPPPTPAASQCLPHPPLYAYLGASL
ncbi:unnamed protein product, partial [Closterium sp. Naga37s-1]